MKRILKLDQRDQRGSILLVFLITLPFLILLAMHYMSLSLTSFQVGRLDQLHTEAQLAADAGADYSVEQLSENSSWAGTGSEVTLLSNSQMRTAFSSSVSGDSSSKTIAVVGKTYWPASATTPSRTVSIYVSLYPVTTGNYSIVTGAGGLYMSNNSKIVGGDVLINGEIHMSNSAQIGLSTNPVNVQVADDVCPNPPDSTYPQVCASGESGQPITLTNSAHIYGKVTATNQTDGSGMSNTGLVAGGSTAPQPLPTYDRTAQESAVTNTMSASSASCSNNQTVTWPANTKITGNVTLSNDCKAIIQGDIWITGSLNVSNSSSLAVDDSVGSTRPNIMVDGASGVNLSNGSQVASNSDGTGAEFYTFYSTASCSPDCTSVTGTDLANSRAVSTINISNNSSAPNTIFYAYWTQVQLSNSGAIGAVIGQTVRLSNASAITFGAPANGTSSTTWVIKGYRRQ